MGDARPGRRGSCAFGLVVPRLAAGAAEMPGAVASGPPGTGDLRQHSPGGAEGRSRVNLRPEGPSAYPADPGGSAGRISAVDGPTRLGRRRTYLFDCATTRIGSRLAGIGRSGAACAAPAGRRPERGRVRVSEAAGSADRDGRHDASAVASQPRSTPTSSPARVRFICGRHAAGAAGSRTPRSRRGGPHGARRPFVGRHARPWRDGSSRHRRDRKRGWNAGPGPPQRCPPAPWSIGPGPASGRASIGVYHDDGDEDRAARAVRRSQDRRGRVHGTSVRRILLHTARRGG